MTKKIIFWAVVAVIFIGIGLYLKFSGFGDTIMALIIGAVCAVAGWLAKMLYDKYVKPVK